MTAAPRGSVRAHSRTSLAPIAVEGARPRPARNAAATLSYPLDGSVIDRTSSADVRASRYVELRACHACDYIRTYYYSSEQFAGASKQSGISHWKAIAF